MPVLSCSASSLSPMVNFRINAKIRVMIPE
ncbi:Uncharacterised protein [Mycobacterium tuberculosis]|uniref:Uncharacterized protein n=1 Tax=Mycobacterium tuberculosis TaxID=1773 RepID=A0A916LB96_MYCTX|nr:Uncharacterised protein [Mycobacterium tuberculosis]COX48066.1 Uncharacterised protein [Mycobacterium tuberculosis]COY08726.1 Uncharacterised protein [Mycobacterium tuberculosis]